MNLYTQPDLLRAAVEQRHEQLRHDAEVARLRRLVRVTAARPRRRRRWVRRPVRRPQLATPPLDPALTD